MYGWYEETIKEYLMYENRCLAATARCHHWSGGEPTTTPKAFDKPESLKAMLELDLKMKKQDVQNYVEHARLADELGEVELKLKLNWSYNETNSFFGYRAGKKYWSHSVFSLEEMAADEARHARELRRLLKGL